MNEKLISIKKISKLQLICKIELEIPRNIINYKSCEISQYLYGLSKKSVSFKICNLTYGTTIFKISKYRFFK